MKNAEADGRWDFYLCRVDDAAASIQVALHFETGERPVECDTLHVVSFEMRDADDHGMGSEGEAERLWPAEDALIAKLTKKGFVQVGRLRNRGNWQLSFYGPARRTDKFLRIAEKAAKGAERRFWTHVDGDAEWSYYTTFLLPDAERRKWMADRAVVDQLLKHGDVLATPRKVDHELHFPSTEAAELFLEAAQLRGYVRDRVEAEPGADGRHMVLVHRVDPVELDHIHGVVMDLAELAAPYDGDHTGWGCSVEKE